MSKKLLIVLVIGVCLLALGFWIWNLQSRGRPTISKLVTIPQGASAKEIASILRDAGIIRSQTGFILLANIRGAANCLRTGEYEFNNRMALTEILNKLIRGEVATSPVTIPEGYTLRQIARLLGANGIVQPQRFLKLCYDPSFFRNFCPIRAESLEGYLFANTYSFSRRSKEKEVIELMAKRLQEVITEEDRLRARGLGLTIHEILIIASLIEWEAKIPSERPLVSAVFHNRLKRGQPLQSCASVLYALGEHKPILSYEDLKTPSPYNTYLHRGLPPGPICSPGMASLKAALNPAKINYLYFVSNGDGTHTFSKTYPEHIKAQKIFKNF